MYRSDVERRVVGLSHDYHEFVQRAMIAAGARVLARMAIDILGLSEDL